MLTMTLFRLEKDLMDQNTRVRDAPQLFYDDED
jgi:hypothetical protein